MQRSMLTTSQLLEGYHIIEQCGVVHGEKVYLIGTRSTNTFGLNLVKEFRPIDVSDSIGPWITQAREEAFQSMMNMADNVNANAIVSINYNVRNIGFDVVSVSVYGTAVKVISNDEFENHEKREQKEKELKEAVGINRKVDDKLSEGVFLSIVNKASSVREMWDAWQKLGIAEKYPGVHQLLIDKKGNESRFGAYTDSQLESIKNSIRSSF